MREEKTMAIPTSRTAVIISVGLALAFLQGPGCSSSSAGRAGSGTGGTTGADGATGGDDAGGDAAACFPLFHACSTNAECCAPNRCLNITGTLECQQEGPAVDGSAGGSTGGVGGIGGVVEGGTSGNGVGGEGGKGSGGTPGGGAGGKGSGGTSGGGAGGKGTGGTAGGAGGVSGAPGAGGTGGKQTFSCGQGTCTVGESFCDTITPGGTGGNTTQGCDSIPSACASTPTCACLCPPYAGGGCIPLVGGIGSYSPCSCSNGGGAVHIQCGQ
jgi:hypothetical protein